MGAVKIIKDIWCDRITKMKSGTMSREERLEAIKKACLEREKNGTNKYPKNRRKKYLQQTRDYEFVRKLKVDKLSERERKLFEEISSWK